MRALKNITSFLVPSGKMGTWGMCKINEDPKYNFLNPLWWYDHP